ncbi:MAG TPA: MlaD family protein [Caldimonas sp.]|nr:MlaD family protein [Caldimonas sp.]
MEPDARYSLVGTAVLVLIAVLAAGIVWLAASGNDRDSRVYDVRFVKQSLEGLAVRSDVRMKGIRVGEVKSLSFSRHSTGTVEATLAVDPRAPVLQSTRAVIDRNIITGLATVRLVNLDETSPPLAPTDDGHPAVIAEGSSQFQQFSETVSELARRADVTLERINETLSPQNIAAIGETIENVRVVTRDSTATLHRVDTTLAKVGAAADALRGSTTAAGEDFHRLALRYESLGEEASRSLAQASASVGQITADASALTHGAAAFLFDTSLELRTTAQEFRRSSRAIGDAAQALSDPRSALLGPRPTSLGPGEEPR